MEAKPAKTSYLEDSFLDRTPKYRRTTPKTQPVQTNNHFVINKRILFMSLTDIEMTKIRAFCNRWKIEELAFFGSFLRDDFGPDSDIDVLVTWADGAQWSLFDWVDMQDELAEILGREVDMVSKSGLRNPFRRHEIIKNSEVVYVHQTA